MINLPSHKALLEKNVQKDFNMNAMEIELEPIEIEEKKSIRNESPSRDEVINLQYFQDKNNIKAENPTKMPTKIQSEITFKMKKNEKNEIDDVEFMEKIVNWNESIFTIIL